MAVICFDYDGVIADTFALESTFYLDIYKQHGIHLFETGEDLRNACRGNFYEFCEKNGLTSDLLDQIFEEYNQYLEDHRIEVPLFEGIVDLLTEMLKKHSVYIVSLNDANVIASRLEKALSMARWLSFFAVVSLSMRSTRAVGKQEPTASSTCWVPRPKYFR